MRMSNVTFQVHSNVNVNLLLHHNVKLTIATCNLDIICNKFLTDEFRSVHVTLHVHVH